MTVDRKVRRAQTITPFGVGAIYDFGAESFVAMDISKWRVDGVNDVRLPRLESVLQVKRFKGAPIAGTPAFPGAQSRGKAVPYTRFPAWLFCPNCRAMHKWGYAKEETGVHPVCPECKKRSKLAPMRFMAVCKNGHLMEVPWVRWAHRTAKNPQQKACRLEKLIFKSDPKRGAGTQSLIVACRGCGAENDLEILQRKDSLNGFARCDGKHPWQSMEFSTDCDQVPQTVQRGGSNAYFPQTVSAIDIRVGEAEEGDLFSQIRLHEAWKPLVSLKSIASTQDNPSVNHFIQQIASDEHLKQLGVDADMVWSCLQDEWQAGDEFDVDATSDDPADLLREEWAAFTKPPESTQDDDFIASSVDLESFGDELEAHQKAVWLEFRSLVKQITLARKLRIVTALTGFSRLEPNYENAMTPSLGVSTSWLPAAEIYGEGIFIALDPKALESWEKRIPPHVLAGMRAAREATSLSFLPEVSERFVLLHTLAHLLIRQLCFECGYSSSSLTERIYSDADSGMAGILIYTASADSEGALGGLVRQGLPDRLFSTFKTALFRGNWCSNDPICQELPRQGIQGLNKSACHACTLVAETACNHANCLLDRSLLIGDMADPSFGYFSHLISLTENTL